MNNFHIPRNEQIPSYQMSCSELRQILITKYGRPCADFALRDSVENLEYAFKSLTNCKDKTILDLGCGADTGSAEADANPGLWSPWLCRAAHELGAKVTGIDIGFSRRREEFDFRRANLLEPECLADFTDHSFDAINCSHVLSSPELVFNITKFNHQQRYELRDRLKLEIKRLLKPGGVIICFDEDMNSW